MTANAGENERMSAEDEERHGDVPADTFAVRLVLVRHHAGRLSIEKAAEKCGLNAGNWANWEGGRQPRDRAEVAGAIADALGVDFNWLFWGGPLEGPKGRPVRHLAKRPVNDTLRYSTSSVRPMSTRTRATGPKGRGDTTGPPLGRPVVIDHSTSSSAARPTNAV